MARYQHALTLADRQSIVEILRDTKKDLPEILSRRNQLSDRDGFRTLSLPARGERHVHDDDHRSGGDSGQSVNLGRSALRGPGSRRPVGRRAASTSEHATSPVRNPRTSRRSTI